MKVIPPTSPLLSSFTGMLIRLPSCLSGASTSSRVRIGSQVTLTVSVLSLPSVSLATTE